MFKNTIKGILKSKDNTNLMILFMSSSNLIGTLLTIVSGLLVAKWILPEALGQFNSYTIFSGYIILAQLGIPIALGRELPLYLGRSQIDTAERYAKVAQSYALLLGFSVLSFTILISFYFLFSANYISAAGAFITGVLSFQGLYVTKYLKILYRGNRDFNRLSIINLINAIAAFSGIYFVYIWGFYGLCIRAFIIVLVDFALTYMWRPTKVKPGIDKKSFIHLFKLGFPMFLVTNIYSLWPLLQKTMILALGGKIYLGLYAIAIMVQTGLNTLSGSISSVIYATMSREWGKGQNVKGLFRLTLKPIGMAVGIFIFIIPVGWIILPHFVERFIPKYIDGVLAGQWMMITGFVGTFGVISDIYNVVNYQKSRILAFLSGFIFWFIALMILYHLKGMSLEIFPQAMAIGYLVVLIFNLSFVKRYATHTFR